MLQPPNAVDALSYVPPLDPIAPLRAALRGHYEIEREIGQGAFATVYLARDLKHERKVALKVLNADPTSETGELRFIREIRVLARLQHHNILPLHDSGHVDALLYYVMPYVTGETLRGRIDREKQLPVEAACSIAREVAEALGYAHAQGIIHRDIKPENILLSAGHPVLADFGIARVIDVAGVMQLTKTGMGSPGTPAYMSPEQLMGDKVLDGRSDTYSLGCVLFEMLTGKPPFAGKEGFVRRFTEPPPRTSSFRRDLPSHVDEIIGRALARAPGDRYQTAEEFAWDLFHPERAHVVESPSSTSGPGVAASSSPAFTSNPPQLAGADNASGERFPAQSRVAPRWMRPGEWVRTIVHHPRVTAATALSLVLASLVLEQNSRSRFYGALGIGSSVDTTRIVVLPLTGSAPVRDRTRVTDGIYSALSEWRGLNIARDQDVKDEIQASGAPASTHSAAQLAKKLRAGRFIWGQVTAGDSLNGRIELYDLNTDTPRNSVTIAGVLDGPKMAQAARELLEIPGRPHFADGGDGRTTSYPAWTAYGRGHLALQNGDLSTAQTAFRAAIDADPDFGPAHLWLAQSLAWESPEARQDWRDDVAQALRAESGLSSRDLLVATALSHMAERQYPQACASYSQLTKADSLDFVGLYGLGQCHAFDSLVVRGASASGWQFRSRYSDAVTAYMKALSVNPSAHAMLPFAQVQDLLPVSSTKTRRGMNAAGEELAAYPALIKDSVIFVPYPLPRFAELSPRLTIASQGPALARNLDQLLEFASEWTRESPPSSAAYQALADVLEARGEINRSRSGGMSAIQAIEKARELAASSRDSILAASSETWLLFKESEFARARALTDSLLKTLHNPTPEEAGVVIGLAALTGKIGKTAELSRLTPGYAATAAGLPIPVMDAAAPFFAFSALGVCGDTTTRLEQRLDDQITHYVAEDQQLQTSTAVKARPLSMQTPCTRGRATLGIQATGNKLMKMQQALASSDSRTLNALLVSVSNEGRAQRPGDIALDFTYQVAWLRAASGDTAEAARQLDRALGSLPSLSASSVREPASAASAGRSMALRAEIAAARGDVENRRKWAGALVDLWSTADSPLQPVVARMRLLAAPDHRR